MNPTDFRALMGHLATGVSVVSTVTEAGEDRGFTANSLTSVSLEPPLVLVSVGQSASSHAPILDTGRFAVSILGGEQGALAERFASGDPRGRFEGVAVRRGSGGCPILEGALAWLECRVRDTVVAGDHTVVFGEVLAGGSAPGAPLIFFRGRFGGMEP